MKLPPPDDLASTVSTGILVFVILIALPFIVSFYVIGKIAEAFGAPKI